ncbi:putative bifunctional diguanylate cyclase/phosphodiesterase [Pseudomonas aeruginosa]|uniref:putative bifunctional diguanylate cyclase/phosphodiesterase n=1 Tax=Pseudomonas aeruginosa TaxID=287 RepID=UPI00053EDF51|nr:EAL domain-containing protein [Pseudomonas aeruginosa]
MKSHPDAASRSAAEVVTQLPVPSRLGLLRFERLNEPSWALLFLDPACERQLGLPATTLCALLDAPYASLMEPEARHRLHEQIQQQLVKRPHYQVSYKLHTPNGVLTMLEFGEAFQQHGRQLLHGYLMVEERAESAERSEQLLDLESQNLRLKASLDLYQRSQDDHLQHLLRSRTQQNLMKYAGLALHKAKANGKHQVQVFTEALTAEASYKLFVESNLRRALAQNELAVHYQPKLCLRSGQLLGLEALLRWQHPEKGMIRPDRFISVAEETGLIVPIGKWVIREACRQARELAEAGLGELQIAINLSPKQFTDPDLVGSIAAILHEENIPASQLELELTESLLLDATDDTRQQLERLKSLGLTLAMDDFGTGYSSLSYLKKFPIDVIKIDRSFIKDIPDSQDDMEITSAVIAMAHNLKLKVVAEGVESAEQLAFLRRNRCDIGQGYLFDRPIPSDLLNTSLLRYPCRTLH